MTKRKFWRALLCAFTWHTWQPRLVDEFLVLSECSFCCTRRWRRW